jgi:hypothetical protein
MLIVIPVSFSDEKLIKDFSKCLEHFGPYENHHLLVVSRPSDASLAVNVFNKVKSSFASSEIFCFEQDGTKGWPQGPNFYWRSTINYLKNTNNQLPWLWMELDMTPLKHGWIDTLEQEYNISGKHCLGWTQDTTTVTTDQIIIRLTKHLVGAAIYPPDISECCTIWEYVDRIPTAFDVLCQWELIPNTHHTTLFQHCFRTQNYKKLKDGKIKGEDHNGFPGGLRFDFPIDPNAVLHHGCDDGSLARLLTKTNTPKRELLLENNKKTKKAKSLIK